MRIFIPFLFLISISSYSQYGIKDSNRIGIQGGITYGNLFGNKIKVNSQFGWSAGMHLRGNFYNDFQIVYGFTFNDVNFNVPAIDLSGMNTEIQYKLSSIQFHFVPSYIVVENRFNIEGGLVIQLNDRLKINENFREFLVKDDSNIVYLAKDILKMNIFNPGLYAGINAGVTNVRLRAGYTFFVTTFNQQFKGNMGQITAALVLYL